MNMKKIAMFLVLLIACQPKAKRSDQKSFSWEYLLQTWIFLERDEKTGFNTYRTKAYEFPPARGRDGYDFQKDGKVIFHTNSPTDRPIGIEGRWKLDTLRQTLCIQLDEKNATKNHCLKIHLLDKDKMTAEVVP